MKFKGIWLLFFLIFSLKTSESMDIVCFDVGQGNCTLVVPKKEASPFLIVDCGSSSNKARTSSKNPTQDLIDSLSNFILDSAQTVSPGKAKDLIIIISHPDEDHYNLLAPLVTEFFKNRNIFAIRHILLGGEKSDYKVCVKWKNKKVVFKDFIEDMLLNHGIATLFPTQLNTSCNVLKPIQADYPFQIFFVPKNSKYKDAKMDANTNAMSLIVQVIFDGKKALIQGDATDQTTKLHLNIANESITPEPLESSIDAPNYELTVLKERYTISNRHCITSWSIGTL